MSKPRLLNELLDKTGVKRDQPGNRGTEEASEGAPPKRIDSRAQRGNKTNVDTSISW